MMMSKVRVNMMMEEETLQQLRNIQADSLREGKRKSFGKIIKEHLLGGSSNDKKGTEK